MTAAQIVDLVWHVVLGALAGVGVATIIRPLVERLRRRRAAVTIRCLDCGNVTAADTGGWAPVDSENVAWLRNRMHHDEACTRETVTERGWITS